MSTKFGCFHTVYENKKATEFILQEFRKYHPMHHTQFVVMVG